MKAKKDLIRLGYVTDVYSTARNSVIEKEFDINIVASGKCVDDILSIVKKELGKSVSLVELKERVRQIGWGNDE